MDELMEQGNCESWRNVKSTYQLAYFLMEALKPACSSNTLKQRQAILVLASVIIICDSRNITKAALSYVLEGLFIQLCCLIWEKWLSSFGIMDILKQRNNPLEVFLQLVGWWHGVTHSCFEVLPRLLANSVLTHVRLWQGKLYELNVLKAWNKEGITETAHEGWKTTMFFGHDSLKP